MLVTAIAKNIRISPEKVKLVVEEIKKMSPKKAVIILPHVNKASSMPLKKVIASAIANAKNNYGLDEETLKFDQILVGKGPMFKRFRAVARGRAHSILKRTSHITIILNGEKKTQKPLNTKEIKPSISEPKTAKLEQKQAEDKKTGVDDKKSGKKNEK